MVGRVGALLRLLLWCGGRGCALLSTLLAVGQVGSLLRSLLWCGALGCALLSTLLAVGRVGAPLLLLLSLSSCGCSPSPEFSDGKCSRLLSSVGSIAR